jgi:hypothetical protein
MEVSPSRVVNIGKKFVIKAANIQWVKEPHAIPDARTVLGKISEINTQITDPCPIACAAMKEKIYNGTNSNDSL